MRRPGLVLNVALAVSFPLAATAASPAQQTPEQFAQAFYDWYAPLADKQVSRRSGLPSSIVAIRRRPAVFSKVLATMIEADWAAQSKCSGYIVGLDYDPFLQVQDPEGRYRVTKGEKTADGYRVWVSLNEKPTIVANVAGRPGHWRFTDFADSEGHSVTQALRSLAKDARDCPKD